MFLTQKNQIRGLSAREAPAVLGYLCRSSQNMSNLGLIAVRQHFFQERHPPHSPLREGIAQKRLFHHRRSEWVYHQFKQNQIYNIPYIDIAQHTLKVVECYFKWFFGLVEQAQSQRERYRAISIPKYLPKKGYFDISEPPQVKGGQGGSKNFDISAPPQVKGGQGGSKNFDISEPPQVKGGQRGSKNKHKQRIKETIQRPARLTRTRNNRVREYLNKSARYIINYCIQLIRGCNLQWKYSSNQGQSNNQKFVQIPNYFLCQKLEAVYRRYGIEIGSQEESYRFKGSLLHLNLLPEYNPDHPKEYLKTCQVASLRGQRSNPGVYRAKDGTTINPDGNGGANILHQGKHRLNFQGVGAGFNATTRGLLANPLIKPASTSGLWKNHCRDAINRVWLVRANLLIIPV